MLLKSLTLAVVVTAGVSVFATDATAQRRSSGFTITCNHQTGRCTYQEFSTTVQSMRWHDGVYVEGDGDLGRVTAANEQQCESLCFDNPRCVMAEFYYGRESRRPACNLFSRVRTLLYNSANDATVGVWR